jgi:hypothetical protein
MFSRLVPGRYSLAPFAADTRSSTWLKRLLDSLFGRKS